MEEVEEPIELGEKPVTEPVKTPEADSTIVEPITSSSEGFSVLQKGLLLAVILGCVAGYVRMSNKRKGRFDKSSV